MKKQVLLILLCCLILNPYCKLGAQNRTNETTTYSTVLNGSMLYSNSWGSSDKRGIYSFPALPTTGFTAINNSHGGLASFAGVYKDGNYYSFSILFGYETTYYYRVFDTNTWQQIVFNSAPVTVNNLPSDLTYDSVSNKVYGVIYNSGTAEYSLCTFDLANGNPTVVGYIDVEIIAIAANKNGALYGVSADGNFYGINKNDATIQLIGYTGYIPNSATVQSMTFDNAVDKLYWAACLERGNNGLMEIDPQSGAAQLITYFPNNEQMTGLYAGLPVISLSAPDIVKNVAVNVDVPGSLNGKITFQCPTLNYGGEALQGLLTVTLYIDDEEHLIIPNLSPGEVHETSTIIFEAGERKISAIVSNAEGSSLPSDLVLWMGHDVPEKVRNLTLTKGEGGKPTLSWLAPENGLNNGYLDFSVLKYKIIRNPDNAILEEDYASTTYVDTSIEDYLKVYSYTVIPYTPTGEGEASTSESMIFNEVCQVPFSEDFASDSTQPIWTVVNSNGGNTWAWDSSNKAMRYESEERAANDWLFSPPVELHAGAVYSIKYAYKAGLYLREENMNVTIGTSTNPSEPSTMLKEHIGFKNQSFANETVSFIAPANGTYHLGFYAHSDADKYAILVNNIHVDILFAAGLPGAIIELNVQPAAQGELSATLSFKAPATTPSGMVLDVISGIAVYRNGEDNPVKTFDNPTPGQELTWTDMSPQPGMNTYRIAAYNDKGTGPEESASVFVGEDIPSAVTNISLTDNSGLAVISWEAPISGINNGYLNTVAIVYKIERNPGKVLIAEDVVETEYTDDTITEFGKYTYIITPSTGAGEGTPATSNEVFIGDGYIIPYHETFETKGVLDFWTIVDLNGGNTWAWNSAKYMQYAYHRTLPGDDWLISPPLKLYEGYTYEVSYKTWSSGYSNTILEKMKVALGASADPEGLTIELNDHPEINNEQNTYTAQFTAPTTGSMYIGFYVYSEKDKYNLRLDDISVTLISTAGVPAPVSNLSLVAGERGELSAIISFTSPSTTYTGTALAGLSAIHIYKGEDSEPAFVFDNPAMNKVLQWTDEDAAQGMNTYRVVAFNEAGAGMEAVQEAYVGLDTPLVVEDLKLENIGEMPVVSWTAPSASGNGGYFDGDELTYKIIRLPDNTVLTENFKGTSYQDESPATQNFYSYSVQPIVPFGSGPESETNALLFGTPYSAPFSESFAEGEAQYTPWTSLRLNGHVAEWAITDFGHYPNTSVQDDDNGMMSFNAFYSPSGEEALLVSPKIDISSMTNPILTFYLYHYIDPGVVREDKIQVQLAINGGEFIDMEGALYLLADNDSGWTMYQLYLLDYINSDYINLGFKGMSQRGNNIHIDNISIEDSFAHDLEMLSFSGSKELDINTASIYSVQIMNNGATTVADYKVNLYKNDVLYDTLDGTSLVPHSSAKMEFQVEVDIDEVDETFTFKAEIEYSSDENQDNNTSEEIKAVVKEPAFPAVNDLAAVAAGYNVELTWSAPGAPVFEEETEDFEEYEAFSIDNMGDWTMVDVDQGHTVSFSNVPDYLNKFMPMAFQVFNMSELNIQNPLPYSGDQMLACFSTDSQSKPNNDWLISPLLPGVSQIVSFYTRSLNNNYPLERIIFHYSTEGTDLSDFTQVSQGDYVEVPSSWTKYEFKVPEGTTYFAIQCVSDHSYVLFVDCVSFIKDNPLVSNAELIGYDLYRDGIKIKEMDAGLTSYTDEDLAIGTYQYKVVSVYDKGISYYSNEATATIATPDNIYAVDNQIKIYSNSNVIIIEGACGMKVQVTTIEGKSVYVATAGEEERISLPKGVYIVRVGTMAKKVLLGK